MTALLQVRGVEIDFPRPGGRSVHALRGVDLTVQRGEMLGLLGESGCGKSTLARALQRLLPKTAGVKGKIEFAGNDLLQMGERDMARIRGAGLCAIPQDPGQALNPVLRVGDQVSEVLYAHRKWPWKRCRDEAEALLARTRVTKTNRRMYDAYPHQLSGGEKQRVVIAQALACEPALVIADEPTASLDSQLALEIVQLLNELRVEHKMSLLFITHSPSLLMGTADRIAVMYAGRVIEDGASGQVLREPRHPYTRALLNCRRPAAPPGDHSGRRLQTIAGSPPDPEVRPAGCSFAPRCTERLAVCDSQPPVPVETDEIRRVECLLYDR